MFDKTRNKVKESLIGRDAKFKLLISEKQKSDITFEYGINHFIDCLVFPMYHQYLIKQAALLGTASENIDTNQLVMQDIVIIQEKVQEQLGHIELWGGGEVDNDGNIIKDMISANYRFTQAEILDISGVFVAELISYLEENNRISQDFSEEVYDNIHKSIYILDDYDFHHDLCSGRVCFQAGKFDSDKNSKLASLYPSCIFRGKGRKKWKITIETVSIEEPCATK